MKLGTYLALGRVSNLPTVWSNALAGALLGGARPGVALVIATAFALSLFYVGGMFLNDWFDREHDAARQPTRPIPAGRIGAGEVFAVGCALLVSGSGLIAAVAVHSGRPLAIPSALALAATIVVYDAWHKGNPLGPVFMALCRALVYLTSALAVGGHVSPPVLIGALALTAYVFALTLYSKRGGQHVAQVIAGISLVDAALLAFYVGPAPALVAALGFPLTRFLSRWVRGT